MTYHLPNVAKPRAGSSGHGPKTWALTVLCALWALPSVAEITTVGEAEPVLNHSTINQRPLASGGSEDAEAGLRCFQGGREIVADEGYQFVQLGEAAQSGAITLRTAGDKSQLSVIGFGDTVCTIRIQE